MNYYVPPFCRFNQQYGGKGEIKEKRNADILMPIFFFYLGSSDYTNHLNCFELDLEHTFPRMYKSLKRTFWLKSSS